ncbi:hypothetical protein [Krasilnikovia sp. MM14-A1259]|uniref:COG1470 family protein n=1 Tax=Krasilnikovia sp. MM14-A1259 TaxID=3373539 RepID=UPI00381ED38D
MTLPLRVTVAPERADAAPGDALTFDVTVRNASDIVEHYALELLGLPEGATVRTEPEVAKLRPSETGTLTVRVTLPVQPPAPAGTYVLGALVKSRYRDDVSRCVEVPLQLAAVEQITLRATPEIVTGGRAGRYTIEIGNGGNAPVRLYLAATDPERRVRTEFQPPWVDLPPGTSAQALLSVQAPLPWNKEKQRQLTITATPDLPGAAAGTGTATFVQQPRFASKFAKVAGIGAAVALLAAAIAVPALVVNANKHDNKSPQNSAATGPQSAAAPPPAPSAAPSSAAAPSAPASSAATASSAPPSSTTPSASTSSAGGGGTRDVDLGAVGTGVLASDAFRNQGFLASADPGTVVVAGCEDARSVAIVAGPDGRKFLTSSSADDPAKCHTVPLMIDFAADAPAGSVKVTPLNPDTLEMEVVYRDLTREVRPDLTVANAAGHGGIDFVLVRPRAGAGGATPADVAITGIRIGPLG